MKRSLIAFFAILMALSSFAQVPLKENPNYIIVHGKAIQKVTPDEIYLRIVLTEGEGRNELSVAEQEANLKKGLDEAGIDLSNLKITNVYGSMQNRFLAKDKFKEKKEYMLKVGTAAEVSKVFEVAKKQELENVRIHHVDHSNIVELRKEVRKQAIKAAKEKAEYTLGAIGQTCGTALSVREVHPGTNHQQNANVFNNFRGYSYKSSMEYVLDFDEIEITSEYEVYFEIQ